MPTEEDYIYEFASSWLTMVDLAKNGDQLPEDVRKALVEDIQEKYDDLVEAAEAGPKLD